ncbi:DNA-processing protein DprA [Bacteroidota bacterium]
MSNIDPENFSKLRFLLSIESIGSSRILSLLEKLGSIENIFSSTTSKLQSANYIYPNVAKKITDNLPLYKNFKNKLKTELEKLKDINAKVITYWDQEYPILLKNIYSPPLVLYLLGDLKKSDDEALAVVGTRRPTEYGKDQAVLITRELANYGITIISGLARGIDSVCHRTALENNGRTIAVIGSGLNVIYPPENKKLFYDISQNGAIVSEYPLDTNPDAPNFPKRNRIISGLALGTIVVETRKNGGALQTAAYALDQNREVFAVPGKLGIPQSEGTNILIQKGEAKLIIEPDDILSEINIKLAKSAKKKISAPSIELNLFEQKLFDSISGDAKYIDLIAEEVSLSTTECLVHLLSLEFKGLVIQLPGKLFKRAV